MYSISRSVLRSILKKKFSSLVGRSCKRIEVIRDTKDISADVKFTLIRDLIKELNYETMREIEETVSSFSDGVNINVKLERPISS